MKFDLKDFRTDKDAKAVGVWIEFGAGAEFKIASFDNPGFTEAFRKMTKPYNDLGRTIPEDDQQAILVKCMAAHIVLDWKGVFLDEKELPYSAENAEKVLNEFEWVLARIVTEAKKIENFKAKASEATEKNSPSA
jgi:hypothetical protein